MQHIERIIDGLLSDLYPPINEIQLYKFWKSKKK